MLVSLHFISAGEFLEQIGLPRNFGSHCHFARACHAFYICFFFLRLLCARLYFNFTVFPYHDFPNFTFPSKPKVPNCFCFVEAIHASRKELKNRNRSLWRSWYVKSKVVLEFIIAKQTEVIVSLYVQQIFFISYWSQWFVIYVVKEKKE